MTLLLCIIAVLWVIARFEMWWTLKLIGMLFITAVGGVLAAIAGTLWSAITNNGFSLDNMPMPRLMFVESVNSASNILEILIAFVWIPWDIIHTAFHISWYHMNPAFALANLIAGLGVLRAWYIFFHYSLDERERARRERKRTLKYYGR